MTVDLDLLGNSSFELFEIYDHKLVYIIKVKAKVRMFGYWKLNSFLFEEKDFQERLEQMLKHELMGARTGNRL